MESIGLIVESELAPGEARQAQAMLASFLPADAEVVFGVEAAEAPVQVTILDAEQLQASLRLAERLAVEADDTNGAVLVTPGQGTELTLTRVSDPGIHDLVGTLVPTSAVILISRNDQ